jgi:hypothetical protein
MGTSLKDCLLIPALDFLGEAKSPLNQSSTFKKETIDYN